MLVENYINLNINTSWVKRALLVTLVFLSVPALTNECSDSLQRYLVESVLPVPSQQLRVGIFESAGSSGSSKILAKLSKFNRFLSASIIRSQDIKLGALEGLDVMLFPGGSSQYQVKALDDENVRESLFDFIRRGGGYLGICAGGFNAAQNDSFKPNRLAISPLRIDQPGSYEFGKAQPKVSFTRIAEKVFGHQIHDQNMYYFNGPMLGEDERIEDDWPFTVLATYQEDPFHETSNRGRMPGHFAITANYYESGRVLLYSTHPEETEEFTLPFVTSLLWVGGVGSHSENH